MRKTVTFEMNEINNVPVPRRGKKIHISQEGDDKGRDEIENLKQE